jgi:hypothetical protein
MDSSAKEQQGDGFWVGMLDSNCCMEAQWILAMHFRGVTDDDLRCDRRAPPASSSALCRPARASLRAWALTIAAAARNR